MREQAHRLAAGVALRERGLRLRLSFDLVLDGGGHIVECVGQAAELVVCADLDPVAIVALADPLRAPRERPHGIQDQTR